MAKAAALKASHVRPDNSLQDTLDGMSQNERINFLNTNSHRVKEREYLAPLSEEDLDEVKNQVTILSCKYQELEDEKQRFMDEWKVKAKAVEDPLEELVREARSRKRAEFGKVWDYVDRESGILYSVAEGNLIIDTRKADSEELAPRIHFSE